MRKFEISASLKKELNKLSKKDRSRYKAIIKKIKEIVSCPNVDHYKNLRRPLHHLKRVHVDTSFVLTFEFVRSEDLVRFIEVEHHDRIYR